jgi:hypothetical protein
MGYGWRQVFIGGREKNELAREKMWSRIYLTPLLQAEEDRDQARRHFADLAREKELLGSTTSAYNSDRYVHGGRLVGMKQDMGLMSGQICTADVCDYAGVYDEGLSLRMGWGAVRERWRRQLKRKEENVRNLYISARKSICNHIASEQLSRLRTNHE